MNQNSQRHPRKKGPTVKGPRFHIVILVVLMMAPPFLRDATLRDQWVQTNVVYINCFAASGPILFVGTRDSGVFRSTNKGANWTQVVAGLSNSDVRALAIIGGNLFAG